MTPRNFPWKRKLFFTAKNNRGRDNVRRWPILMLLAATAIAGAFSLDVRNSQSKQRHRTFAYESATTGAGTSATIVRFIREPPATTGLPKFEDKVAQSRLTDSIANAERRSRLEFCVRQFVAPNTRHVSKVQAEVYGPAELSGFPQYKIQFAGPSDALSQKDPAAWERIEFYLLVDKSKNFSHFIFFSPEAQIQKSPQDVSPPIGRYQEMTTNHVPMLTDFQERLATYIKKCIESGRFDER